MRSVTPSIESAVSRGAGLSGIKYCGGERAGGRSRRRGAGAGRGLLAVQQDDVPRAQAHGGMG